jgi:hypothetical protein
VILRGAAFLARRVCILEHSAVSTQHSAKTGPENDMVRGAAIVKAMYQFAIDMGEENSYTPATPQGVKAKDL